MIIVLDVGNTNTKIGIFDGDTAVRSLRLSSSVNQTSDEYGFTLSICSRIRVYVPKTLRAELSAA